MTRLTLIMTAALITTAISSPSYAGDIKSNDKTVERNGANAREVSERREKAADRERMRDKSHDGRVPVGKDTSVGGGPKQGGAEVNVKKTF